MTLDEAIKHAEEVMMNNLDRTKGRNASDPVAINCFKCAEEHRQLAGWLKEYKRLLELESHFSEICMRHYRQGLEDAANKPGQIFSPD